MMDGQQNPYQGQTNNDRQEEQFLGQQGAWGQSPWRDGPPPNMGQTPYYYQTYFPKKKKNLAWLWVILSLACFFGLIALGLNMLDIDNMAVINKDYIATLHIQGTMTSADNSTYSQAYLLDTIDQLINDNHNVGLMLYIDSPGGEVYTIDELYMKLNEYKLVTERPIYAYCAQMAASGGYYTAMAAEQVYSNRNGWVGSIGVILGAYIDISGFLAEHGIKTNTFVSGPNKGMGSIYEEMTEEQQEILQSVVDETYEQFLDIVANSRGMERQKLLPLADGRIYTANQAWEKDLIDGVCSYGDAMYKFRGAYDFNEEDIDVRDFYYHRSLTFYDRLFMAFKALSSKSELEEYIDYIKLPVQGPAYYFVSP